MILLYTYFMYCITNTFIAIGQIDPRSFACLLGAPSFVLWSHYMETVNFWRATSIGEMVLIIIINYFYAHKYIH